MAFPRLLTPECRIPARVGLKLETVRDFRPRSQSQQRCGRQRRDCRARYTLPQHSSCRGLLAATQRARRIQRFNTCCTSFSLAKSPASASAIPFLISLICHSLTVTNSWIAWAATNDRLRFIDFDRRSSLLFSFGSKRRVRTDDSGIVYTLYTRCIQTPRTYNR
jgi:hypothetical protein